MWIICHLQFYIDNRERVDYLLKKYQTLVNHNILHTMGLLHKLDKKSLLIRYKNIPLIIMSLYLTDLTQNTTEARIRELKKLWYHINSNMNVQKQFWDCGV